MDTTGTLSGPTLRVVHVYAQWTNAITSRGRAMRYAVALLSVTVATALMVPSGITVDPANSLLIYLLVVLLTATTAGAGAGIVASLLSFLAYNFFFVLPLYTLYVANPQDILRLFSFLIAALLASGLSGLVQRQAELLRRWAAELEGLYLVSQATSAAVDLDQMLPALAAAAVDLLKAASCIVTVHVQDRIHTFQAPSGETIPDTHAAVVLPILLQEREVGSIRVLTAPDRLLGASERRLFELLARQAALVVERARLAMQAAAAQALEQADRLKSSLLSSVSHDLRTPLVAIIGNATALRSDDVPLNSAEGQHMLDTIISEAERLNRLVGNLLNMSRIESGALQMTRAWDDIGNILGGVLARMRPQLQDRAVRVIIPPETPMVWVNAALIDQVLTNLLDNAIKYTPDQTPIQFEIDIHATELLVHVIDDGPGIAADALPYIFDKFFRVIGPERHADGTGLGLAICKGIVEAHGGRIWAENRAHGGAEFVFTVPLSPAAGAQPASRPYSAGDIDE